MIFQIEISSGAENDILTSLLWYEEQQSGLGKKYEQIVVDLINSIQKIPFAYQEKYKNIRIAFSKKFSFGIHFIITDNLITIVAVFHTSRNPKLWKKR
jgi:uncharacterized membrane protein